MIDHEDWDPASYDPAAYQQPPSAPTERPQQWYRENAAVFHAIEQWESNWIDYATEYEHINGRPPSTTTRHKNKAEFRRRLCEQYGRGEPDGAWLDQRTGHLEKRGMAPERGDGGRR